MTTDAVIRAAAVAAAVALLVAPQWGTVLAAAVRLAEAARDAAKAHGKTAARVAAAGLIVAAAWGKVPLPRVCLPAANSITVETPDADMQTLVGPVAKAMAGMTTADRLLWASTWTKAAVVVSAPDGPEAVFTDTRSLRLFTTLALDIAWRRLGGHEPGSNEPLRHAVEAAYAHAVGTDVVPVTKAVRERYAAFAKAVAWAGMHEG